MNDPVCRGHDHLWSLAMTFDESCSMPLLNRNIGLKCYIVDLGFKLGR